MMRPSLSSWVKRALVGALCLGGAIAAQPAKAQLYVQVPFVSIGVGPYYSPYYYGYPYYYRAHYWGWRHRNWCRWHPYRCHHY